MSITSVTDLASFCLVCHLQQLETCRLDNRRAKEFLDDLLQPAHLNGHLGKLKNVVEARPNQLCYADNGYYIALRRGWPNCSLPTSNDDGNVQSDDEDSDLEETIVDLEVDDQNLEKQAPTMVTLLRDAANRYSKQRLDLKRHKGGLGKKPRKSDTRSLAQRFKQCVRDRGILTLDVILAEIDHVCNLRKISEDSQHQETCSLFVLC